MNLNDPRTRALWDEAQRQMATQLSQRYDMQLQQAVAALRAEQEKKFNGFAAGVRREHQETQRMQGEQLANMARIADAMKVYREGAPGPGSRPGIVRIEDIPGRRIPYTLLMDIPISANTTAVRESTTTISMDGPFVAVKRIAAFQSAFQFQFTNDVTGQTGRLAGRSYGRYRPFHSAADLLDAQHAQKADTTAWFLAASAGPPPAGTVLPSGTLAQASNMSSFRTMEFDGRIEIVNAGSSWPRQNIPVPSTMWSNFVNSPFELACLDFFERGETLTIRITPTHVNNPAAGNVDGENVFPAAAAAGIIGYPFVDGQYDAHEGIAPPNAVVMGGSGDDNDWEPSTTDSISRLPDGIVTIGWEGYRIIQTAGPIP